MEPLTRYTPAPSAAPSWLLPSNTMAETGLRINVHLVDATIASDSRFFDELADVTEQDVVVKLGAACNGNEQTLQEIRRRCPARSIQKLIVYGHGAPGGMGIAMGKDGIGFYENAGLTMYVLQDPVNRKAWGSLRRYFRPDGVVVLRGCNTAQGPKGETLIKELATILGRPVQASDWYQRVGRSDLLGNVRTATPGGTISDDPALGQRNLEKLPFLERWLFRAVERFNDPPRTEGQATGWRETCQVGLSPAGKRFLGTTHTPSEIFLDKKGTQAAP